MLLKSKVFIHGFLGQASDWKDIAPYQASIEDLWLDIANLHRPDQGFKDWAENFLDNIDEPIEAYGYSLGARLLLHAALIAPNKFKKLVFFSLNPGLQNEESKKLRWQKDCEWMQLAKESSWLEFTKKWQEQDVFSADPKIRFKEIDQDLVIKAIDYWSLAKQENLWSDLTKLPLNTYFLAGEKDLKFAATLKDIENIRGKNCILLKNVGHRIPFNYNGEKGDWHWQS